MPPLGPTPRRRSREQDLLNDLDQNIATAALMGHERTGDPGRIARAAIAGEERDFYEGTKAKREKKQRTWEFMQRLHQLRERLQAIEARRGELAQMLAILNDQIMQNRLVYTQNNEYLLSIAEYNHLLSKGDPKAFDLARKILDKNEVEYGPHITNSELDQKMMKLQTFLQAENKRLNKEFDEKESQRKTMEQEDKALEQEADELNNKLYNIDNREDLSAAEKEHLQRELLSEASMEAQINIRQKFDVIKEISIENEIDKGNEEIRREEKINPLLALFSETKEDISDKESQTTLKERVNVPTQSFSG